MPEAGKLLKENNCLHLSARLVIEFAVLKKKLTIKCHLGLPE
jgi:hypothetical protein